MSRFWSSCPHGESRPGSRTLEEKRWTRGGVTILACHGRENVACTSTVLPQCASVGGCANQPLPHCVPPARSTGDGPAQCQEAEPIPSGFEADTADDRGGRRTGQLSIRLAPRNVRHSSTRERILWCRREDSNPRPEVYKTPALPTELRRPPPILLLAPLPRGEASGRCATEFGQRPPGAVRKRGARPPSTPRRKAPSGADTGYRPPRDPRTPRRTA